MERYNEPEIYAKLPAIFAGKFAKELSVYTDRFGSQAVVLPNWAVSLNENENVIWGPNQGLVLYARERGCYDLNKITVGEYNYLKTEWIEKTIDRGDICYKYSIKENLSQIVWVPVRHLRTESLERKETFFYEYSEKHENSINKYGGFFISRYKLSSAIDDPYYIYQQYCPKSVKASKKYKITLAHARQVSSYFYNGSLPLGRECDLIKEWIIESGTRVSKEEVYVNNLYDFATGTPEWTLKGYTYGDIWGSWAKTTYPTDCRCIRNPYDRFAFRATYFI